jgi:hypothetical protein
MVCCGNLMTFFLSLLFCFEHFVYISALPGGTFFREITQPCRLLILDTGAAPEEL